MISALSIVVITLGMYWVGYRIGRITVALDAVIDALPKGEDRA